MKYFPPDKPLASVIQLNIKGFVLLSRRFQLSNLYNHLLDNFFILLFRVEYFDEAFYMDSEGSLSPEQTHSDSHAGESPPSSHVYTPPIFSIKHLKLSGVTLQVGQGPNTRTTCTPDPRAFADSSAHIVRSDMYRSSLDSQGTESRFAGR